MDSSAGLQGAFWEHLGAVDIGILALLGLSTLWGACRGFSRETGSVLAWAGALWIALQLQPVILHICESFSPQLWKESAATVWGLRAFLFVIFLVILNAGMRYIGRCTRDVLSGGLDSLLGGGFGFARGYVFLIVILTSLNWAVPSWLGILEKHSILAPYIARGAEQAQGYFPSSVRQHLVFPVSNPH